MSIQIREIKNNRDLKTFIRYPLTLYKGNPHYVPSLFFDEFNTLRADKNPAFVDSKARFWLATRDNKIVGRVAALLVPTHEQKWGKKLLRFGWLDFIDDAEVLKTLMEKVENWANELGMDGIHGPLGFTDLDREGLLIDGFDEDATLTTLYNYPYYKTRLEELGFVKAVDWVEYEISLTDQSMEKIKKAAEIVSRKYNLKFFKGSKKELSKIAPQIFDVVTESYRHLYGTVPFSKAQVKFYIDSYFGFALKDLIPVVFDENDRVVAFGISFPSFTKALQKSKGNIFPFGFIHFLSAMRKFDRADLYLIGVRDEYLGKGVNSLVMYQMYDSFLKHGVKYIESSPNLEHNQHVQTMWKFFNNRQHKRRRCFVKYFNEESTPDTPTA